MNTWRVQGLLLAAQATGTKLTVPALSPPDEELVLAEMTDKDDENISPDAIRAALQHTSLLRHFHETGVETALILEDDVDFGLDLKAQLESLSQTFWSQDELLLESGLRIRIERTRGTFCGLGTVGWSSSPARASVRTMTATLCTGTGLHRRSTTTMSNSVHPAESNSSSMEWHRLAHTHTQSTDNEPPRSSRRTTAGRAKTGTTRYTATAKV